ncbi:flagellar export chaperone FliS [Paenibacillus oryzae]|uniref:Flagellar secretion chaperone FliS n=1 Tax=Paenibacillus oryzae TaxID=1844972 RepID=A0A1A5YDA0_9BACL|nr:flagellar export chaperone FliS [Paenibacillus oryzae]OBR63552.1 flagellar export chaperone FliS [Paenibacillus oryzae]
MINNPYHKYQESSVQTATPAQLIIMLYDGAIRFTKQAIHEISQQRYGGANQFFIKAQSIIHELIASLDANIEISKNLYSIYEYLLHLLIQANTKKSPDLAEQVITHLEELREAWRQAIKQNGGSQAEAGATK